MAKPYIAKELVYYVDGEKNAKQLQRDLYETYKDVAVYVNGLNAYRVVVHFDIKNK